MFCILFATFLWTQLFPLTKAQTPECFSTHIEGQSCYSCSWDRFFPEELIDLRLTPKVTSDCKPKNLLQSNIRKIVVSRTGCPDCSGFSSSYATIMEALISENKRALAYYNSEVTIYLHGASEHYILPSDYSGTNELQLFRRVRARLTITPLFCMEFAVLGCLQQSEKAIIKLKTLSFEIFVAGVLILKSLYFDALGSHLSKNSGLVCVNSSSLPCCTEEQLKEPFGTTSSCGLGSRVIYASDANLEAMASLLTLEMIADDSKAAVPELSLVDCKFENIFGLEQNSEAVSFIGLKEMPAKLTLTGIRFRNVYFLNGFFKYQTNLFKYDPFYEFSSYDSIASKLAAADFISSPIVFSELEILNYNPTNIRTEGEGGKSLFQFSLWRGSVEISNFNFSNVVSNHESQYLFACSKTPGTIVLRALRGSSLKNIGFIDFQNSKLDISLLYLENYVFSKLSSFAFYSSTVVVDNASLFNAIGSADSRFSLIYGGLTELKILNSKFVNWKYIAITLKDGGNLRINNTDFMNVTFRYALISNNLGEVYLGFSSFIDVAGDFFVVEVKKTNFSMSNSVGSRFKCQAAVNIEDCYYQNFSHCSFSQMSGLETFWTSSRLFKIKNVFNTTFSDSTMKVLLSFYIGNTWDPAIFFDQTTFRNIIVTEYFLEFCCTNFSLTNSRVEDFLFENVTGRCFGVFEVYSHYFFINTTFHNVGWETYPEANAIITRNFYRSLIFLWFANSITLKNISYTASKEISLPTGIIAIGSFDGWVSISGLKLILKMRTPSTPVRVLLISYAVHINFEDSVIVNAACPSVEKKLTFFHYNGVIGFYNFPQYGGEKSNTKWIKFVNTPIENCSCNSGGALTIINYNYIELRDCVFLNSKSEQDGGHFFIISSNELNITNVNFTNSSAQSGAAIFLSQIVNLILEDIEVIDVAGRGSGAGYMYRVENAVIRECRFKNLKMMGNGGTFFIEESKVNFERIVIENSEAVLGGMFFVSFGSSIEVTRLSANRAKANSGGIFFIDETKNFIIVESNFSNIIATGLSSVFHVKAYTRVYFKAVRIYNSSTPQKGTIFLKTLQADAPSLIDDLVCGSTNAVSGTCVIYEGAAKLAIWNTKIEFNRGYSALEFNQPSYIVTEMLNISLSSSRFNYLILGSSLDLLIENAHFTKCELGTSGIELTESKLRVTAASFSQISKVEPGNIVYLINLWGVAFEANDIKLEDPGLGKKNLLSLMYLAGAGSSDVKNVVVRNFEETLAPLIKINYGDHKFSFCKFFNYTTELINGAEANITVIELTLENSDASIDINTKSTSSNNNLLFTSVKVQKLKGLFISCDGFRNITIANLIITGRKEKLTLDAASTEALRFIDTEYINLFDSNFSQLRSDSAPAFKLEMSEFSNTLMKVKIYNSSFQSCFSYFGGVFASSGDLSISLINNNFSNNTSKIKKDQNRTSGIGGVGVIRRKTNNVLNLKDNRFQQNFAESFASTIFSEGLLNDLGGNFYLDNLDLEGQPKKVMSYPIKVKVLANLTGPIVKMDPNTFRINMTSGQEFNLTICLEDAFGQLLNYDSISVASVEEDLEDSNRNSISIEVNSAQADKGVFFFEKLIFKVPPNSSFGTTLNVKLFEERNAASEEEISKTFQTIKQPLLFFARPCLRGEIKLIDNTCYQCPGGFYSIIDPMASQYSKIIQRCESCPENSECQAGFITPESGYWRSSNTSTLILRCPNQKACLGKALPFEKLNGDQKVSGVCANGHFGHLCNDCDYGYGKFSKGGLCQNCNDDKALIALRTTFIIVLVVGYIVLNVQIFTRLNKNKESGPSFPSLVAKILVSHFHQVGIVTFMENIFVLPSLENFIDLQNFLSFLSQDFLSIECIMQSTYYDKNTTYVYKVLSSIILPIAISIMAAFFWFLLIFCLFFMKNKNNLNYENTIRKILIGFTISVYVFYPMIIQSSFSLLNCVNLANDTSEEFLYVAPNMPCWDAQHTGYIFSIFLPGIIVFGLLFPLFLYNVLRLGKKYKARSNTVQERINQLKVSNSKYDRLKIIYFIILDEELFRFFYDGYKEKLFFWEVVIFSKKFLLTMCASVNQLIRPQTKNLIILIILFFHFSISLRYQPFRESKANRLDQSSLLSTFITSMCMIFISAIFDPGWRAFFGVITIIVNVAFVALLAYYILNYIRLRKRMVKLAPKSDKIQVNMK